MVAVPTKPYASAAEESEALEQLPPQTRWAILHTRSPFSPTVILKMFRENDWPLACGAHDRTCAERLYERDYAVYGDKALSLH